MAQMQYPPQQQPQYPPQQQPQYPPQQQPQYPPQQQPQYPPQQQPQYPPKQQAYGTAGVAATPVVVQSGPTTWHYDTFDCFGDIGLCASVYFCYPCVMGHICGAIDKTPETMDIIGCLAGYCFPQCTAFYQRQKVRETYNIPGGCLGDLCCSLCCFTCTTCQTHRELTSRGMPPGGFICESSTPGPAVVVAQPTMG